MASEHTHGHTQKGREEKKRDKERMRVFRSTSVTSFIAELWSITGGLPTHTRTKEMECNKLFKKFHQHEFSLKVAGKINRTHICSYYLFKKINDEYLIFFFRKAQVDWPLTSLSTYRNQWKSLSSTPHSPKLKQKACSLSLYHGLTISVHSSQFLNFCFTIALSHLSNDTFKGGAAGPSLHVQGRATSEIKLFLGQEDQ